MHVLHVHVEVQLAKELGVWVSVSISVGKWRLISSFGSLYSTPFDLLYQNWSIITLKIIIYDVQLEQIKTHCHIRSKLEVKKD